ncbi:Protein of unknown function [Gryllus bimaculatus]|nr:Protein of unknown function [Gryllus bimaculatus]
MAKGPYKLVLREFLACDDQGAHTLRFDLRRRLLDSGLPAYSGKVTFPQDLDNDVKPWAATGLEGHECDLRAQFSEIVGYGAERPRQSPVKRNNSKSVAIEPVNSIEKSVPTF